MIILKRPFRTQRVRHHQPRSGAKRHRNRHRTIQINHRRRRDPRQRLIQRHNPRPIRFFRPTRSRMASRNLPLQHIRPPRGSTQLRSPLQRPQPATNQQLIPIRTILLQQQNRRARFVHARSETRSLYLHQRHQPMHFRLLRRQLRQNPPQSQRIFAQRRPQPVVTRRRRVALIKNQINHRQHRRKPRCQLLPSRHLKRHALFSKSPLRPHNALRHSRFGHQKRSRNFLGRQPSQQTQRQRHTPLARQHRMARDKYQPQQIVAHIIIESRCKIWHGHLFLFHLAAQLFVLALQPRVAPEMINRAMLGCGHQPCAGIIRHARLRPLLQRGNQSVLRQILGDADVAHHPREAGDNPGGFNPPDCVNRAISVGSAHSYPSHHLRLSRASRSAALRPAANRRNLPRCFRNAARKRRYFFAAQSVDIIISRTSVSPSHPGQSFLCSSMKPIAPCTASSFDFSSNSAYPPIISLASVNGPSITVTRPPESRTLAPAAVGSSPPLPSSVPALIASSVSLPIASINSFGGMPCASLCFTIIMYRIVKSPYVLRVVNRFLPGHPYQRTRLRLLLESFRPQHLPDFGFTLPSRPVFLVQLHKVLGAFDRLFLRFQFEHRKPAHHFLRFGVRPVNRRHLPSSQQ